jgi:hypothetical protein
MADTYTVQPGDGGWYQIAQKLSRMKGYSIDFVALQKLNPQYTKLWGNGKEVLTIPPKPGTASAATSTPSPNTTSLESLTFWFNAFIPNSVCTKKGSLFVITVPGSTLPGTPAPPFPTMRFFTGDQRDFSSDIGASARMHSEVTIAGLGSDPRIVSQKQLCGASHEVDDDGNIIATDTAGTDDMKFFDLRGPQTVDPNGGIVDNGIPGSVQIGLVGSASLPLVALAPDIDYLGTLIIDRWEGNVLFKGLCDRFPAYELYYRVNGGPPITLARIPPITPTGLIGPPNRNIDASSRIVM